jgi:biopolymer transport protein ExbD
MAMSAPAGDEDEVMSTINTTPLVDVMLVMLIIFLITVPVIAQHIQNKLPDVINQPTITKPENITIEIDKDGNYYWGVSPISAEELLGRLKEKAVMQPQPEFHIRGDKDVRYEYIGKAMVLCQRAGIVKVGFITQPEKPGAGSRMNY